MNQADIISQLEHELALSAGTLRGEIKLAELAEWDSLTALSFILAVQNLSGKTIPGERVSHAVTVRDLVALVEQQVP